VELVMDLMKQIAHLVIIPNISKALHVNVLLLLMKTQQPETVFALLDNSPILTAVLIASELVKNAPEPISTCVLLVLLQERSM